MLQDWDETDSFCTVLTHSGASTNQTRTGLSQVHSGRIGFKFKFDSKTVSFTYVISPHQLEGIGWRGWELGRLPEGLGCYHCVPQLAVLSASTLMGLLVQITMNAMIRIFNFYLHFVNQIRKFSFPIFTKMLVYKHLEKMWMHCGTWA